MFILASSSLTRKALLEKAGLTFLTMKPDVDESTLHQKYKNLSAKEFALKLASEKSFSISAKNPNQLVVGADQILYCNQTIFHKPSSIDEARGMLQKLRGREHQLTTAISCQLNGEQIWNYQDEAKLTLREYSDSFLESYLSLNSISTLSSAGAYQLESHGIQLFDKIEGDYFTILGFPLVEFLKFLRNRGILET